MQITTKGIVIRDKTFEDDRILTILTKELGVITAYAKGAKRLKSSLSSSTELFCYSHFVLFKNRDRYIVDSADSENIFFGIRKDVFLLGLASYFSELMVELAPKEEDAGEFLRLLLNTLFLLENGKKEEAFLKPVFELRLLTMAGYMPDLVACSGCGCFEAEEVYFYPNTGNILCGECKGNMHYSEEIPLPKGILAAMRHIIYADFEKLYGFQLSQEGLKKLGQISEKYVHAQLSRTFQSLEFYHSLFITF